jgi:hypothetical protein
MVIRAGALRRVTGLAEMRTEANWETARDMVACGCGSRGAERRWLK